MKMRRSTKPVREQDAIEQLMDFIEALWDAQGLTETERLERVKLWKERALK